MATIDPLRGEIWKVQFDKAIGQEIRKTRPAVVMNMPGKGRARLRLVAPVTTGRPEFVKLAWMTRILAKSATGLDHDSFVDASQIQPASLKRFIGQLGVIPEESTLESIAAAVALCVGHSSKQTRRRRR